MPTDFLDVAGESFPSLDVFIDHLHRTKFDNLDDNLKVIGSISDFTNTDDFIDSVDQHFHIHDHSGDLIRASAQISDEEEPVPYYIFIDGTFPLFFTTGTLTKQIPPTLQEYILSRSEMSRMWIAKRQMERLRQSIVSNHPHLIVPFFTGKRTRNVNIPAQRRGEVDRTVVYYGDDGLETFREMKHQYGILPANIDYEVPGQFKFRVKENGIITLLDGGIREVYRVLEETKHHLRQVKDAIDTSKYGTEESQLLERQIPYSEPWAIELESGLVEPDVSNFRQNVEHDDHDLTVTEYSPSYDPLGFSAEVVDTENFARTEIRSARESIRLYPNESADIDQNIRLYNFVDDYIDPHCRPVSVQ